MQIFYEQYVQVTGKYQAQPNQTADAVKTQPGSVIQLEAKWDNAKNRYIVTTLRSQGVDVISHPLKTIFQHRACTSKLYADSFYKVQKNSHSSFEVICCGS